MLNSTDFRMVKAATNGNILDIELLEERSNGTLRNGVVRYQKGLKQIIVHRFAINESGNEASLFWGNYFSGDDMRENSFKKFNEIVNK